MIMFVLIGLSIFGFAIATFLAIEILAVIISGAHAAITKMLVNHKKFIQKVNFIGLGKEGKRYLIRGFCFSELDEAYCSAMEYIPDATIREHFYERRRKVFNRITDDTKGAKCRK